MSQDLFVNGKRYVQSSALASDFGYSSDYIGKLARDEKVLGTLVGRQWFIEPESFAFFLQKIKVQKEIRKDELRRERKLALETFQTNHSEEKINHRVPVALAQTLSVVMCGLLVGSLGWISVVEGVKPSHLAQGGSDSFQFILAAIAPIKNEFAVGSEIEPRASLAASAEITLPVRSEVQNDKIIFTTLPVFSRNELVPVIVSSSSLNSAPEFSDEVKIVVDKNGNKFIEPVFKSKTTSAQRYLLTPINVGEN